MNTNGIEQPVWEPMTQRFYVSLPEIDGPGDGTGITGAVARVTTGGVIETIYPINYCQPAGLTLGPNGNLLVGCNSVFDNSGKKCTAVVPAPSPTTGTAAQMAPAKPATCTGGTAYPQVAICNPGQGCTGNSLQSVFGVGGGDEVWFNSGDGNYYVTAGNNPIGPTFGVVNSSTNTLTQLVPTLPPPGAVCRGGDHDYLPFLRDRALDSRECCQQPCLPALAGKQRLYRPSRRDPRMRAGVRRGVQRAVKHAVPRPVGEALALALGVAASVGRDTNRPAGAEARAGTSRGPRPTQTGSSVKSSINGARGRRSASPLRWSWSPSDRGSIHARQRENRLVFGHPCGSLGCASGSGKSIELR